MDDYGRYIYVDSRMLTAQRRLHTSAQAGKQAGKHALGRIAWSPRSASFPKTTISEAFPKSLFPLQLLLAYLIR